MKAVSVVFLLMACAPSETKADTSSFIRRTTVGPPMEQSCLETGGASACSELETGAYEIISNVTCRYDTDIHPQVRVCSFELNSPVGKNICTLTDYWSVSVAGGFWRPRLIVEPALPSRAEGQTAVDAGLPRYAPVALTCSVAIADYARRVTASRRSPEGSH